MTAITASHALLAPHRPASAHAFTWPQHKANRGGGSCSEADRALLQTAEAPPVAALPRQKCLRLLQGI